MEARLKGSALKSRDETSGMDRTIEGGEGEWKRGEEEQRSGVSLRRVEEAGVSGAGLGGKKIKMKQKELEQSFILCNKTYIITEVFIPLFSSPSIHVFLYFFLYLTV